MKNKKDREYLKEALTTTYNMVYSKNDISLKEVMNLLTDKLQNIYVNKKQ